MKQLSIDFPPASRRTDPVSSALAERDVTAGGSRAGQMETVLQLVRRIPGLTSLELTLHCDLDRYQVARRLSDLRHKGLVYQGAIRACGAGGRKAVTWYPIRG